MIIRLHPDTQGHWPLYDLFEQRCIAFGEECGWPITPVHKTEMRRRFVEQPHFAGYFLNSQGTAHLFSWFVILWGQPGITVFQAKGDKGVVAPLLHEFFNEALPAWVTELETLIKRPLEFIEFDTERPEEWKRALRPFREVERELNMTIVRLRVHPTE